AGTVQLAQCPGATQLSLTLAPSGRSGGSCRARLRVTVTPRHYTAGRPTTFRVKVRAVLGSFSAPLAGATIVLAGRRERTGPHGGARLRLGLGKGRHTVLARAAGFIPGRERLISS